MFVYIIIHGMYQTTIFRIHYIFVNYFCFLDGNPEVFVSINLQFFLKPSKTQVSMNYTEFSGSYKYDNITAARMWVLGTLINVLIVSQTCVLHIIGTSLTNWVHC
jgi:hypothetical protein